MREIEPSNRFYQEKGAYFMTSSIVYNVEAPVPLSTPVTFILAGDRLVTVRYAEPKAFPLYMQRVDKGDAPCANGAFIMTGLIEALIHRMADLIERIQDDVDKIAQAVFDVRGGKQTRNRRLDVLLKSTGKAGDITARAEESATSVNRLLHFFVHATHERGDDPRMRQRIKAAQRDITSLLDHTRFLSGRIAFLLDATLGTIANEQNQIIKLFSVMAVVLLPPTLIASIYGMNFQPHARARLGVRLSVGAPAHGHRRDRPGRLFPPQGLALGAEPRSSTRAPRRADGERCRDAARARRRSGRARAR